MADMLPIDSWTPPNQPLIYSGKPGACAVVDDLTNQNLLVPWSYQTGLFLWTYTGAGAPLLSPADETPLDLFTTALGETIPGGWYTQHGDDTNLPQGEEGAPVCRGQVFYAMGLAIQARFPFLRGAGGAATDSQYEATWLGKNGPNGPQYGGRIQRAALNNVHISIKHNNPSIEYPIGVASDFAGYAGVDGGENVRNGSISDVEYVPLAKPFAFGSKDDCRQLKVTLTWGKSVTIENDASQPTVAGPNTNVVYVPIKVIFFGQYCKRPAESCCVVAPISAQQQAVPPPNNSAQRAW
jgi:hypothetical protein